MKWKKKSRSKRKDSICWSKIRLVWNNTMRWFLNVLVTFLTIFLNFLPCQGRNKGSGKKAFQRDRLCQHGFKEVIKQHQQTGLNVLLTFLAFIDSILSSSSIATTLPTLSLIENRILKGDQNNPPLLRSSMLRLRSWDSHQI